MKMLLTSNGLNNNSIKSAFKNLFNKNLCDVKVMLIPTASRSDEEMVYVHKTYNEVISTGVLEENIVWFDIEAVLYNNSYYDDFEIDCFVVCGGNTHYLLSKLKESKYLERIIARVKSDTAYVGVSAGSVITSKSIRHIEFMDENDVGLKDASALGFLEQYLIPHFEYSFHSSISDLNNLLCISDDTAVQVIGDSMVIV